MKNPNESKGSYIPPRNALPPPPPQNSSPELHNVKWLVLGKTEEFKELKSDIAHVCHDVTEAGCIDEICISDIIQTFKMHGYKITKI